MANPKSKVLSGDANRKLARQAELFDAVQALACLEAQET